MSKVTITDKEKAKRKKVFITVLTIVGGISFLGSTSYGMVEIMRKGMEAPVQTAPKDPAAAKNTELQARAKGYEIVLQREPNNLVALEGLAMAKIELNDAQGAIAPLEKLVQINPQNPNYKAALEQVKKGATQPK